MTYFVIPHYIVSEELKQLAINTIVSMRKTSQVFIVSVDDGSPMPTYFLEDLSDHTIHLPKNSGFAVACNAGFRWVLEQKYVKFIGCANNDIEVFDGWLQALKYPFETWDDVGITGLISSRERELNGWAVDQFKIPKITEGGLLSSNKTFYMQSGGLWLSKPEVLKKIGYYERN